MSRPFRVTELDDIPDHKHELYWSTVTRHPSGAFSTAMWRKIFDLTCWAGWRNLLRFGPRYARCRPFWLLVVADTRGRVHRLPNGPYMHPPADDLQWRIVLGHFRSPK